MAGETSAAILGGLELGTILIVEPDRECADETCQSLKESGFNNPVVHVASWTEAKRLLEDESLSPEFAATNPPEVVLLSFGLEPSKEHEFVRWIRRQPELFDLIVIALGTLTRHADVQSAYTSGVNAYFIKGAAFEPLVRTLRGISGLQLPRKQVPVPPTPAADCRGLPPPTLVVAMQDKEAGDQTERALRTMRLMNPIAHLLSITAARTFLEESSNDPEAAKSCAPLVLFLDLRLDGSQSFLAWLQANPKPRPIGIIAVTNTHDMRLVIQAYHLGANSFIRIPPKSEEMQNALSAVRGVRVCDQDGKRWLEPITAGS